MWKEFEFRERAKQETVPVKRGNRRNVFDSRSSMLARYGRTKAGEACEVPKRRARQEKLVVPRVPCLSFPCIQKEKGKDFFAGPCAPRVCLDLSSCVASTEYKHSLAKQNSWLVL